MSKKCKIKLLNNSNDWIEEITGEKIKGDQKIEETARNFYSSHTHSGLMWYFYLCWVNGYCACLRPDMLWSTILNEISIMVSSNKSSWGSIFDFAQIGREMMTTMNYNSAIDINELVSKCKKNITNRDIFEILINTMFSNEIPLSNYTNKMIFSCFSNGKNNQPNYTIDDCKNSIGRLDIQGNEDEWNKLYEVLDRLINIKNINKTSKSEWGGFENFNSKLFLCNEFVDYVKRCRDTVRMIMIYKFKKSDNQNFFKNAFSYEDNVVGGWIKYFYTNQTNQNMLNYNSHISYIPYKSINPNNMEDNFLQAGGLCYSVLSKGVLYPQYGIVKFKILDPILYKKIRGIESGFYSEKLGNDLDQYVNFKSNQMNPVISSLGNVKSHLEKQNEQIRQKQIQHQSNQQIPQSVLFSLDRTHVTKPLGGEYLKVFERDQTIPMNGGSLPYNFL